MSFNSGLQNDDDSWSALTEDIKSSMTPNDGGGHDERETATNSKRKSNDNEDQQDAMAAIVDHFNLPPPILPPPLNPLYQYPATTTSPTAKQQQQQQSSIGDDRRRVFPRSASKNDTNITEGDHHQKEEGFEIQYEESVKENVLSIRSPENWQVPKKTYYRMDTTCGIDNRTRTPGERRSKVTRSEIDYKVQGKFDGNDDENTLGSDYMGYLPSRHFSSSKMIVEPITKPLHDYSLHQRQTQNERYYHKISRSGMLSPSNTSKNSEEESSLTSNSNDSAISVRSRRSSLSSHQSSTSLSLLHGEIINLKGDAIIAQATVASKNRLQSWNKNDHRRNEDDYESHHTRSSEIHGMEIGGRGAISYSDTGTRDRGGNSLLSSQGFVPLDQRQYRSDGTKTKSIAASGHISSVKQQAKQLGYDAKKGAVKIKGHATFFATEMISKYYRPPLSPRARELKDLQYLKQSHKKKIGQWLVPNGNLPSDTSELVISTFDDDHTNAEEENEDDNFSDFVLVLTPQEAYKYWADLLDFREEHFGTDSLDVWGRQLQSPSGVSTNTTDSGTSEKNASPKEFNKEKVDNDQISKKSESDSHDDDNDDDEFLTDLSSTPLTGFLRRRGARTPPSTNNATPCRRTPRSVSQNKSILKKNRIHQHSHSSLPIFSPMTMTPSRRGHGRMSMFERAIQSPLLTGDRSRTFSQNSYYSHSNHTTSSASDTLDDSGIIISATPLTNSERTSVSAVRRRWGNPTIPSQNQSTKSFANVLSPPIRSLTRGAGSEGSQMMLTGSIKTNGIKQKIIGDSNSSKFDLMEGQEANEENHDPNSIKTERDIPNPIIPRGIAARTNGMIRFLSALKRGIVVRRHRPNKDSIFCKLHSNDGGDTIQYQLVDPEEAMVAFKEQRVRYNRNLTHSSTPKSVHAISTDWSCIGGPSDGSRIHKFKVPDHVAAQQYREKFQREHGAGKRLFDVALKAVNSGVLRASDIVSVHPATHKDPRHPGLRKGEFGTASLRRSLSQYYTEHSFSLVSLTSQRFKKGLSENPCDTWSRGEGSEHQFRTLDFEAATEGEYWLIFRGLLLLHRDAMSNRFAIDRNAGIGGGARTKTMENNENGAENSTVENRLQQDMYIEPSSTVGRLEKLDVKIRKLNDDYIQGAVMPGAVPPPSDYFLGFKSPGTQIWSRLRLAGLETQRVYSVDTRRVMIKIRCPEDRLTDVAEVLRLKMRTKDGSFAPFHEDAAHIFKKREDFLDTPNMYRGSMSSLLKSKDRQMIIDFIIGSRIRDSGAELAQTSDVGKMIEARIPLHMRKKLDSLYNAWFYYWRREHWTGKNAPEFETNCGESDDSAIEEDRLTREDGKNGDSASDIDERPVPNFLTRFFVEAFNQPLDAIEEYFGEKVTFYFAWLQHCAIHLLFLSFLGLIVTFFQVKNGKFDHWTRPFFSIIVMIWTFVVLVNWRKRSNYLAYQWGSMDHKEQETNRPEFQGEYVTDHITNEWVIKYPRWKRWLKYLISIPICVGFTCFALFLILLVHANRDMQMAKYVNSTLGGEDPFEFNITMQNIGHKELVDVQVSKELLLDPTYWLIMTALPAMLGLCIPILNLILMKIAVMLNDFENYRTDSEYRTHLIIKVFSFRFVSQFGTVYYYAFMSTESVQAIENGMIRMATSVAIYTTVAHWWNIFLQVYVFIIIRNIRHYFYKRRLRKELKSVELLEEEHNITKCCDAEAREIPLINKRILLDQAQDELWDEVMHPPHDSFPEYITAVVQFSFVACFSVILPWYVSSFNFLIRKSIVSRKISHTTSHFLFHTFNSCKAFHFLFLLIIS